MLSAHSHRRATTPPRYGWWRLLQLWQRVLVVGVLLGVLAVAAALIYFKPGAAVSSTSMPAAAGGQATSGPLYPPGTDEYYYWGQSKPLDQQP